MHADKLHFIKTMWDCQDCDGLQARSALDEMNPGEFKRKGASASLSRMSCRPETLSVSKSVAMTLTVVIFRIQSPPFANGLAEMFLRKVRLRESHDIAICTPLCACLVKVSKYQHDHAPAAGRYHLYISYGCPWACRCLAVLAMKVLTDSLHPVPHFLCHSKV